MAAPITIRKARELDEAAMHARFADERTPAPEVYGAPLRLRVENQLGYKMVKWIERIEFIESEKQIGREKAERMRTTSTSTFCPISKLRRQLD